ncbi:hypothetical protein [Sphingobacterium sp.]|uniref:hypothetical protein n=1 Tax=Sphingobacterium sp. TaxID=341027 RepID=UPI0028B14EFE|nr:hypothetical protein [Sphingobacterium sp.]
MITTKINLETRTLDIHYPEFSKQKDESIRVHGYDQASSLVRIKLLKFLSNEIRAFVNMRTYAFATGNRKTVARQKALNHLRFILDSYSEGSVNRFAKHIANSRVSFSELMPVKPSPAKTHFDNHIVPIIRYCTDLYERNLNN